MNKVLSNTFILSTTLLIILLFDPLMRMINTEDNNTTDITLLESENAYLKEQMSLHLEYENYPKIDNYKNIYAKIIFRDIYFFSDILTISRGSKDGLKANMAVINEIGLIGITKTIDTNTSNVLLLTNGSVEISVMVNENYGILKSNGNEIFVSNIVSKSEFNVGDKVYTSGLGNLPSHIYVGEVREIINDNELELKLLLDNRSDLNKLKHVSVLVGDSK